MASLPLSTVAGWLRGLLCPDDIDRIEDYGPNGLQVEAGDEVRRVVTGVTANLELIEAAVAWDADLLIVHHGVYWHGAPFTVTGALGRRLRALIAARLSLIAYHLPLDGHLEVGNAANLARAIEVTDLVPAFMHRGIPCGVIGRLDPPRASGDVLQTLLTRVSDRTLLFPHGEEPIETVGVVTGGAPRDVREALERGLDLFITGEAAEHSLATAREERIHFAACGHHRTERFGPIALAERMARDLPQLEVRFIDVDNPA